MRMNTPLEHQGNGLSGPAVETEWNRIIDKGNQGTGTRTDHQGDPDRGDAVDHTSMESPMRINSLLPDLAPPGQSVIIQGSGRCERRRQFHHRVELSSHCVVTMVDRRHSSSRRCRRRG